MVTDTEEKAQTDPALKRSVIEIPAATQAIPTPSIADMMIWAVASIADDIQPWGARMKLRDKQLRDFFPTEPFFNSALFDIAGRNAAFTWELEGPGATVRRCQELLDGANMGKGWQDLITKLSIDLYTQDHGAFVEVVRAGKSPASPVIGLNHLDAYRCWFTGDPKSPVVYQDRLSRLHLLEWWQVETFSDMPTAVEGLYGLQYCALTRVLRACQVMRNVMIYQQEKTGGRFNRALHIVKGITTQQIQDALKQQNAMLDAQGFVRYLQPLIVGSISAEANIDVKTLELATIPEGWSQEEMFKWYIAILAMGFGADYQDFAPLPGGGLGTSQQSAILHMKSRGKGPALFQKLIAFSMNMAVLPKNVEFRFAEQDLGEEKERAEIAKVRAETRKAQVESGELTPEAARQQALDYGDISQEVFDALGGVDVTPHVTQEDVEQPAKEEPAVPPPAPAPEVVEEEKAARAGPFRAGAAESGGQVRRRLRESAWEDIPGGKAEAR